MLRSIRRNIAKNLLADMGYDRVNRKMGQAKNPMKKPNPMLAGKLMKTRHGRERLARINSGNPKLWQRVTTGDLAAQAEKMMYKKARERGLRTAMYGLFGAVPD